MNTLSVAFLFALTLLSCCAADPADVKSRRSDSALKAWQEVTSAMKVADRKTLQIHTTDEAYAQLTVRSSGKPVTDPELRTLGEHSSRWEIRMISESDTLAEFRLGPTIKEHTLIFAKDLNGWKLIRWIPGA